MKKILVLVVICTTFFMTSQSINANTLEDNLELRSNNAIVINLNDNRILYEKNSEEKIYPASMTKMMTALVAIENVPDLDQTYTISEEVLAGLREENASVAGLQLNQVVSYRDLLYGILLPSGADASRAIAISCFGSEAAFVEEMNKKAKTLKMDDTHFVNTSGLHNDEHYSTVSDIAILLKNALKNDLFKEIFCAKTYIVNDQSLEFKATLNSSAARSEIDVSNILGAKTGYTIEGSLCLASYATHNQEEYIMISAQTNSDSSYPYHIIDAVNMYQYIFEHYSREVVVSKQDLLSTAKVYWGKQGSYKIKAVKDIALLVKDKNVSNIKVKFKLHNELKAPVYIESEIGELSIYDADQLIYQEDYLMKDELKRDYIKYYLSNIDQFVYDFKYIIGILIVSGVAFLWYKKREKNKR